MITGKISFETRSTASSGFIREFVAGVGIGGIVVIFQIVEIAVSFLIVGIIGIPG